jgi:hypothetical protein
MVVGREWGACAGTRGGSGWQFRDDVAVRGAGRWWVGWSGVCLISRVSFARCLCWWLSGKMEWGWLSGSWWCQGDCFIDQGSCTVLWKH